MYRLLSSRIVSCWGLVFFVGWLPLARGILPPPAEEARLQYEDWVKQVMAEDAKAREPLFNIYGKALLDLEDKFAERGRLEGVVATQKEQDRFLKEKKEPAGLTDSDPEELKVVQRQFASMMRSQDQMRDYKLRGVKNRYLQRLEFAKVSLTKARNIEQALVVSREIDRLKAAEAEAGAGPGGEGRTPAQSSSVWEGFETEDALNKWEVRSGPALKRVGPPPAPPEGSFWVQLQAGSLIATEKMPRDWSKAKSLSLTFFSHSTSEAQLELLVGDEAWMGAQTYWNRHNGYYSIKPGLNEIKIPLTELFRGEANARNREIKRNIDLDKIRFISLKINGGQTGKPVFLDALRLIP